MKIKILLIVTAGMLAWAGSGMAGGRRLGTAGGAELMIPIGARNVGIGNSNIANITGMEAMYANPAGMAVLPNVEFGVNYTTYFADMTITNFNIGSRAGSLGVIGIGIQAMNIGEIPVTTILNPEGTGEVLKPNFMILTGSFARKFTDRINFGFNARFVSEQLEDMKANALAFDIGLQYHSSMGIDVGVAMRNYGSGIRFDGTSIDFDSDIPYANPNATTRKTKLDMATHELPTSLNLGLGYRYRIGEKHALNASGLYANNSFAVDNMNVGLEYAFNKMVFLRGGYHMKLFDSGYPAGAKEDPFGLTLGFGFLLSVGGRNILFDYAYRDMDFFTANQYFSIHVGW
ncbi:PorV/PorQ family protein [bacterium]|nr:PorV/PorQ family protein [bacterium]